MSRPRLAAAALAVLLTACASPPAGPPRAAALAARLGCTTTGASTLPQWAYDTVQYADATGGACSDGTAARFDITIITFATQAKEADWLHQNSIAESSSFPDGYFEVDAGHLWVIASDSGGASQGIGYVVSVLGGKDTTF